MNDYINKELLIEALELKLLSLKKLSREIKSLTILCERDGAITAIEEIIEGIKKMPSYNGWIPCSERLPDKDGDYLCFLECGDVCQATFDSTIAAEGKEFPFGEWVDVYNSDTHGFTDKCWEEYDAITHWQPLPEPPKE